MFYLKDLRLALPADPFLAVICLSFSPPKPWKDLKSELKILLCLDHPHVVRLLDVYVSDEKLEMVMECNSARTEGMRNTASLTGLHQEN